MFAQSGQVINVAGCKNGEGVKRFATFRGQSVEYRSLNQGSALFE